MCSAPARWRPPGSGDDEDPLRGQERVGEVPLSLRAGMEDVVGAALCLASDDAAFINGVAFPVDGGVTAW